MSTNRLHARCLLSVLLGGFGLLPAHALAQDAVVYTSGSHVQTWDPIYPESAYSDWISKCSPTPDVGIDDDWTNPHNAFAFGTSAHPWQGGFSAEWINAWEDLGSLGPAGQSWTKYSTDVAGEGDFVLNLLADNCSWVYLDGELVGFQDENLYPQTYPVQLAGTHLLEFIILDGGGLAGGMYRLETNTGTVFPDSDADGLTDPEESLYSTDPYNADTDNDGVNDGDEVAAGTDPNEDPDGDGIHNDHDNCRLISNADQVDYDIDGQGDACDDDDDNDGVGDANDYCPTADDSIDLDGDGRADCRPVATLDGSASGTATLDYGDSSCATSLDWSVTWDVPADPTYSGAAGGRRPYSYAVYQGIMATWSLGGVPFMGPSNSDFYIRNYDAYDADYGQIYSYAYDGVSEQWAYIEGYGGDFVSGEVAAGDGEVDWDSASSISFYTGTYDYNTGESCQYSGSATFGAADTDGDGISDDLDVCPADPTNLDADGDLVCDQDDVCLGDNSYGDSDGDQVCEDFDLCEGNDGLGDEDLDGWCSDLDNCPIDANVDQANTTDPVDEVDDIGDACEADTDQDGTVDDEDNCVNAYNVDQTDNDVDGNGDACDDDDDNDGAADGTDNCPMVENASQANFDSDGLGDACDGDDDADAVVDGSDLCQSTPLGSLVNTSGCSGTQYVALTCGTSSAATHGAYVSCVARATATARGQGLITGSQGGTIVSTAAKSSTGRR